MKLEKDLLVRNITYTLSLIAPHWVLNANNQMIFRPPLFPLPSWNVYTITLNGGFRTNNACEGWNNSVRLLVGQHHPPIYKCIEALQRDNAIVRTHMAQSTNGTRHRTPVKRNYRNETCNELVKHTNKADMPTICSCI